jgi:hypothetical protein
MIARGTRSATPSMQASPASYRFICAGFTLLFAALVTACAHRENSAGELHARMAPFTQARDSAVAIVQAGKQTFDPLSLNQLSVSYTALELKANDYAGFLVESASLASFDDGKNSQYATSLRNGIDAFDTSLQRMKLQPKTIKDSPSSTWVPAFADSVKAYWERYHVTLARASPKTKAGLVQQLKTDSVWPNFEDVATPAPTVVPSNSPTPRAKQV